MNTFVILIVVLLIASLLIWLLKRRSATAVTAATPAATTLVAALPTGPEVRFTRLSETEVDTEPGSGRRFKRVMIEKATPRFTWLLGKLKGKYWAEMDAGAGEEDVFVTRYQFHIYEVTFLVNEKDGVSKGKPFPFEADADFPAHKLPATIPCHVVFEGTPKRFGVVLCKPQFSGVHFAHKLQQEEGNELFGTIEAQATGYIWDELLEVNETIEYLPDIEAVTVNIDEDGAAEAGVNGLERQWRTGGGYRWTGVNAYRKRVEAGSFFTLLLNGIGWLLLCLFVIALLPRLLFLLPLIGLVLLFSIIPAVFWEWLLRIVFVVILAGWVGILLFPPRNAGSSHTIPAVKDYDSVVTVAQERPMAENAAAETGEMDTLVWHYRKWYDYKGKLYEGRYYVAARDYQSAHTWKNGIAVSGSGEREYDYMLSLLRNHDQNRLTGLYQMFDSIKKANHLDSVSFAEVVVACIQQIPYCLVLDKDCNPKLYADPFITRYLRSENARCESYARFGINTPVEFAATGKGDCDSRTLLLYTVLRHFGYRVAILSSEYYNHSLLGIQLPLQGKAYYYNKEPYYCWETTAAGIPAGVLPEEVADMKYWRLSITSQ